MFRFFLAFQRAFRQPDYDLNLNISRSVVSLFMLYKLFSRDFGFYGFLPPEFFTFYPYELYPGKFNMRLTGLPIITEIFTMHWVHWVIPRPTPDILRIIQAITMLSLVTVAVFGLGPRKIFCLISFVGLIYLWGHLVLGGQEVDSVAIYFGMFLVLLFSTHRDVPVWRYRSLVKLPPNKSAGVSRSLIIFIFCTYYFASGFNKLTDILMVEVFDSNLNIAIQKFYVRELMGHINIPDVLHTFASLEFAALDVLGPILVYASHLFAPILLFDRSKVWAFAIFYIIFHFIVFGVGISFTGYILVWLAILPWEKFYLNKSSGNPL